MSTTPFVPGCSPWLQEVLELPLPELPLAVPTALLADAPVAAVAPGWLAAMAVVLPEEPHPAMVNTTAVISGVPETAEIVRDI
jgi:hypothetical protein